MSLGYSRVDRRTQCQPLAGSTKRVCNASLSLKLITMAVLLQKLVMRETDHPQPYVSNHRGRTYRECGRDWYYFPPSGTRHLFISLPGAQEFDPPPPLLRFKKRRRSCISSTTSVSPHRALLNPPPPLSPLRCSRSTCGFVSRHGYIRRGGAAHLESVFLSRISCNGSIISQCNE